MNDSPNPISLDCPLRRDWISFRIVDEHGEGAPYSRPGQYPAPFDAAWLALPEPDAVRREVQRHSLALWLWQNHSAATAQLVETRMLSDWLEEQLDKAERWGWRSVERIQLLLRYQLDPALAEHPEWPPYDQEEPDVHFSRVSQVLLAASIARDHQQ